MHRPELQLLIDNWEIIRDEMKSIKAVYPDVRRPKADYDDLDRAVYSRMIECEGWSVIEDTDDKWWNFPLFTYSGPTRPARKLTPRTVEILEKIQGVYFSGFSILLSNGVIAPHSDDPANKDDPAGYLTYHLGLDCPPHCCLIQGERAFIEEDGKLFNFPCDQTHSAINMSDKTRVILYITFTK
ncbi:hypothetical protein [Yellowstone lake phycodnavirus 3]|jgi:aspartyl/asparaginyl beta-hydroxylase (cupin superfamily)|uniref:hypothetical protein n=1 Tax=Yellowstone lake phycodnavirus 3 TaxID=1586715 RepID=UPI0006EB74AF|nr:hypothetical protein AR677_gp186 [Yellowstone lake phycodnavirus 3]BAT22685.1 hypothetical protein [Yellowstone lake phycodnavirus 3]